MEHTIPRIDTFGGGLAEEIRRERVDAALARLTEIEREIFLLAVVERLPVEEIAERTGRYPLATTMLLSRALRQMRCQLGEASGDSAPAPGSL